MVNKKRGKNNMSELVHDENIKSVIKYTRASILSFPDGTHQIDNRNAVFTPVLKAEDLVSFCRNNLVQYKEYWIKNAAFYNSSQYNRECTDVPHFEPFWDK